MDGGRSMPQHPPQAALGRAVVLAVALALALGACSADNPAPKPLASSTPTASPTATASATPSGPPPLPAAARGTSRAAAVAFVRHWIDTLNYSAATLDTRALAAMSSTDCESCQSVIQNLGKLRRSGGSMTGFNWRLIEPQVVDPTRRAMKVQGALQSTPHRVRSKAGARPTRFAGTSSFLTFSLVQSDGRWRVAQIDRPSS